MQLSSTYTGVLAISCCGNRVRYYFIGAIRRYASFLPWDDLNSSGYFLAAFISNKRISTCNSADAEIVKVNSLAPALVLMSINFLMSRFRSLWHLYCQGGGWYKNGGYVSSFISTVNTNRKGHLCSIPLRVSSKQSLSVRLQVDDDEDECYDDDYPYDTDDSNSNCTIILLP